MKIRCLLLGSLGVLTACQTPKMDLERPLSALYREAYDHFSRQEYKTAAKGFEEVERQHPYSAWATKSQLMSAFCYYMVRDYESAHRTLEVFIQYHPTHKNVAYAYYLKGMSSFAQIASPDRDPRPARDAREIFLELSHRFPESPYAKDALKKVEALSHRLASHEISVGQYYERAGNFLAALERFRMVLFSYPDTPQSEEAAYRAIECYISLGLLPDARTMEGMLRKNTPKSLWTKKATHLLNTLHAS